MAAFVERDKENTGKKHFDYNSILVLVIYQLASRIESGSSILAVNSSENKII